MFAPVYFDHNASTPMDSRVLEAMLPYLTQQYGNASSRHEYGRAARQAVDEARQRVAQAAGAHPTEVVFTSGGSEANNLFIKGAAALLPKGTVAISAIEHPCVRESARQLVRAGWRLREIAVDADCRISSADFSAVLAEKSAGQSLLASIMLANNETGALQNVAALANEFVEQTETADAWLHTDAVQAFGRVPVDFRALNAAGVHAMTVSAHKIGGPKGAGALILDKRLELQPLIAGGGQERGLRSGTENVAAIVGFGLAAELAIAQQQTQATVLRALRVGLESGLSALGAHIFAMQADRLPNTTYFAFAGMDGETLVGRLDRAGFAVASGAACSSASLKPSHVLLAMGVPPALARGAVARLCGQRFPSSRGLEPSGTDSATAAGARCTLGAMGLIDPWGGITLATRERRTADTSGEPAAAAVAAGRRSPAFRSRDHLSHRFGLRAGLPPRRQGSTRSHPGDPPARREAQFHARLSRPVGIVDLCTRRQRQFQVAAQPHARAIHIHIEGYRRSAAAAHAPATQDHRDACSGQRDRAGIARAARRTVDECDIDAARR